MSSMIPYDRYGRALRRGFPIEDLFDELFTSPLVSSSSDAAFKMDVVDEGESYVISAQLAGVGRDEIDVELNEGRLSISVEKKETEEDKGKNYLHKETREWSATRGVYLKDAATEGLSAKLENGVLTVTVPKQVEKNNVTKIAID
ncbi:MAG: Hsp20 family protein [Coriobacteriales bacterium]|nr:Hsp20 family protein [Coriobacteriales bacterium]